MGLHNSTTIRELAKRVHRGQEGRVLDGDGSAGDLAYGYESEYVDPSAAVIVRRGSIANNQLFAEGVWSLNTDVHRLILAT